MKRIVSVFLILFLLAGCQFPGREAPGPGTGNNGAEQPAEKKDYYIGADAPVERLADWTNRYRPYEGVYQQKLGDYRAVLVSIGEKYSAGYEVTVDRVSKREGRWVVETTFLKPAEENYAGGSVFPHEVVSIINDGQPIEVIKTEAQEDPVALEVIEIPEGQELAVSKNFVVFTPLPGERIENPIMIRGRGRVFEATFRLVLEDGHYVLAERMMMTDEGGPGWGKFEIQLPYEEPTNPQGMMIFSYENMETGELVEELMLPVKF